MGASALLGFRPWRFTVVLNRDGTTEEIHALAIHPPALRGGFVTPADVGELAFLLSLVDHLPEMAAQRGAAVVAKWVRAVDVLAHGDLRVRMRPLATVPNMARLHDGHLQSLDFRKCLGESDFGAEDEIGLREDLGCLGAMLALAHVVRQV